MKLNNLSVSLTVADRKRKTTSLPSSTVEYLKAWMMSPEHVAHPYPTEKEKCQIMADTGIELKQLTNWFVNNRKRYWKPRVEARLKQQVQTQNAVNAIAIASQQRSNEAKRVCYNVRLFNPSVTTPSCQRTVSNDPATIQNSEALRSQGSLPGVKISPNHSQAVLKQNYNSLTSSFHHIVNQQYFTPPRTLTECYNEPNCAQVVSTGSASSFSDCDSTALSTGSHDENHESIVSFSGNISGQSPRRLQRRNDHLDDGIIGSAITHHSLGLDTERKTSATKWNKNPLTSCPPNGSEAPFMKRVRSVSDFDAYPSPITIIARPRSLKLASSKNSEASPKRRCVEYTKLDLKCWQNACREASHGYDSSLPTLEEAALLFGFASKN
mmetsp:Transcript_2305/g.3095  ORF Transcript_2305/g.3095 Transcript_2305/m.3095 type:complete len:382 (+) Transcript_2305:152-1297(+)